MFNKKQFCLIENLPKIILLHRNGFFFFADMAVLKSSLSWWEQRSDKISSQFKTMLHNACKYTVLVPLHV